jgi:HEAT repeat protein
VFASCDVYAKVGAVCIALYLVNLGLASRLTPFIHDRSLRWTTAFALVQVIAILAIALYLLARRAYTRILESLYEQLRPAMRERVAALSLAGEAWSSVVPKRGPARQVLEETIAHSLAGVKDSGRNRLAQFAIDQGFEAHWVKALSSPRSRDRKRAVSLLGLISERAGSSVIQAAMRDRHASVRIEAARALLVAGDPAHVDRVFRAALHEAPLTRALLTSDLKRHAGHLLANTIPAVLGKATPLESTRCLQFMLAWKRAAPSFAVAPWLNRPPSPEVWALALRMAPYAPLDDSIADHLLFALSSIDADVRCAAAGTAGRLKLERLLPALTLGLTQPGPQQFGLKSGKEFAIACAHAMAQIGTPGERRLEQLVSGPERGAAAIALEALELASIGLR